MKLYSMAQASRRREVMSGKMQPRQQLAQELRKKMQTAEGWNYNCLPQAWQAGKFLCRSVSEGELVFNK